MSRTLLASLVVFGLAGAARADDPIPADTEIVTTASGLKYSVLQPGRDEAKPALGQRIRVHYTGWLTSGKVFDSSRTRGEPAEFVLGEVIPGWNEALVLMTPGARWKLTIPPALAYGTQTIPGIPPNSTLIFDVELLQTFPLPGFHPGNPAAQKKTESGIVYEALTEGEGAPAAADETVEFKYALWTPAGKLLECSESQGAPITLKPSQLRLKFFAEAFKLLKPGARYRFEVPSELAYGAKPRPGLEQGAPSVWEIELVRILKVPEFEMSKPDRVKTLPSGLQIEVLEEGTGASPKMGETVTVHYAGWLTDGKLFDSSYGRGKPMQFRLGDVIAGWNEGLQNMKVGGKARLTIPASLAYGKAGRPGIPPDATLVFVVELLKIGG